MLCCSPKGVNGMIEIIYKEDQKKSGEKDSFFRIPNNIRQIGEIRGHQKIYIEDYAYTFLKKISRNSAGEGRAAILLGQYHWSEGSAYLFIRSALQIEDIEVSPDHMAFTDKVWGQIYEEEKKYFPEQEIVGWFLSLPGFNMEISEGILKTHLNHFAGNDKTLFVMEPGEREEAFFLYEGGRLTRQPGFYIYYEKNEAMQAYMIEKSQNKSIEETEKIPDRAVVDFRKAVKEKKEKEQGAVGPVKKRTMWMAGACTAAAVLAVGITFFNSYQGMENTVGTLLEGSSDVEEDTAKTAAQAADTRKNSDRTDNGTNDGAARDDQENPSAEVTQQAIMPSQEGETQGGTNEPAGEQQEEANDLAEENSNGGDGAADEERLSGEESSGQDQVLISPEAMNPEKSAEEEAASSVSGVPAGVRQYTIRRGDTLSSICEAQYGTISRIDEVCRLNGISPEDIIYAGQKILLPE